jgi:DNA-binding CsgD family transcriptional regulator/tetratricopeptide (TPR) repeat protein
MAGRTGAATVPVVGRTVEIGAVRTLAGDAARGRASTLLISGEAGVGKTALLRHTASWIDDHARVVWVQCLPLASLSTPLLPLRTALAEARGSDQIRLDDRGGHDVVVAFDAWLGRLAADRPTLLVVDDIQWADRGTLDVLTYVLAGPADRRLAVAATMRTDDGTTGHELRRWLADVRRLPRVSELPIGRLDRVATAGQMAALLGRSPHETLVDDVYARSAGNPYLTSLLVRRVPPDATALPPGLPAALRDALARTWHGLSAPARTLTAIMAVAGRPERSARIVAVGTAVGFADAVVPLLRETVDAGVLQSQPDGTYWFAHPLMAEVLADDLLADERRTLHAGYAELIVKESDTGPRISPDDAVAVADHYFRASLDEPAYRWALTAAEVAGPDGAHTLLHRALTLSPRIPAPAASAADLLRRIRTAAARAGRDVDELAAVDDLLNRLDPDRHPLEVVELLIRRSRLSVTTGRGFADPGDAREAMRLSSRFPASVEHAQAMAELARVELWRGEPAGADHAREAVELARALGPKTAPADAKSALACALVSEVMAQSFAGEADGFEQALQAQSLAVEARDFWAFVHATFWATNSVDVTATPASVELLRRSRERAVSLGAPHTYVARLCAVEADGLFALGDWQGCEDRLRTVLAASPGPFADASTRLTAAQLACRQGRQAEAEGHLARAEEVYHEGSGSLTFSFDAVRAELAVAAGDTDRALAAAENALRVKPDQVERLQPLAARALADRIQAIRDRGGDPAADLARLDDFRHRYPRMVADPGAGRDRYHALLTAFAAVYDAETARAHARTSTMEAWRRAADACHTADAPWDEAYCRWRQAQAAATTTIRGRAAIRQAHDLAVRLRAMPLIEELERLARVIHVPLSPTPASSGRNPAELFPGLTAREREILGFLMSGRTYAEIAATLVLSEKTVGVHVSNMLRKTGTANRVALTQLAHRLAADRSE